MANDRKRYSSDPSERARQLVAEGKIGGAEHGRKGGRPRKDQAPLQSGETAAAYIARTARDNAPAILKVYEDAVAAGQLPQHRLQAVKQWVSAEDREAEREERAASKADPAPESADLEALDREQLLDHLAARLAANPVVALALRDRLSRAVEKQSADS